MNFKIKKLFLCTPILMMLTSGVYGSFKLDERIIIDLQEVESSYNTSVGKAYHQVAKSQSILNELEPVNKEGANNEQLRSAHKMMEDVGDSIAVIDQLIDSAEKDMISIHNRLQNARVENAGREGQLAPLDYGGRKAQITSINMIMKGIQGTRGKPIDQKRAKAMAGLNTSTQTSTELMHHKFHDYSKGLVGEDLRLSTELMYLQITELKSNRIILSNQLEYMGSALAQRDSRGLNLYTTPTPAAIPEFHKKLEDVSGQTDSEEDTTDYTEDMYNNKAF